jgi:phenylacetate-CoA ligase
MPLLYAKDLHSHACCWALIKQRYRWHGLTLSSKQARFYGTPLEGRSKWQVATKDRVMNRKRFVVFDLSDARLAEFLELFRRTPFEFVYGATSAIVVFARYLRRTGLTLKSECPSLKLCMVTSEVCTPDDRRVITAAFGVPTVNEYGASEVGIIAFDSPNGDWVLSDETLFVEAVDDRGVAVPDGTAGRLLVTDLRNRAWPCIRYEIGDVGVIRTPADRGAHARRVLERLEGRVGDIIVLPSGKTTTGFSFYYVTWSLLETWDIFRELQIRQTAPDEFTFDIVSARPLTPEQETEIERLMHRYFEPGLRVRINCVPSIPGSRSGKRRQFHPLEGNSPTPRGATATPPST